jgi:hypothetical protein
LVAASIVAGGATLLAADSPGVLFAGAVALLLASLVTTHLLAQRATGDVLAPISLAALFYGVAFGAGGVFMWLVHEDGSGLVPGRSDIVVALLLVTVAWICFALGYAADLFRWVRAIVRPPRDLAGGVRPAAVVVPFLAAGWGARLMNLAADRYFHISDGASTRTGASWFVDASAGLPLLAVAFLAAHAFRPAAPKRVRFWTALLVVAELAWSIPTGSRGRIVDLLIVIVIVRYYAAGRLPSTRMLAGAAALVVFVVFPFGAAYRSLDYRTSITQALFGAASETRAGGVDGTIDSGLVAVGRFSDLSAVARVVHQGRDELPLAPGESLVWAAQGAVPRAIYPDKPEPSRFANEFGRAYGFIAPADFQTAIAVTQPGEMYLNGGWLALVLGMALLGAAYRLVAEYLSARRTDPGVLAVYATAASGLVLGMETIVALGFVGVVKTAILFALAIAVAGRIARPSARIRPALAEAVR